MKEKGFFTDGVFLKDWAVKLSCPILSIDYSLAPEAPFPRALEEVFYAYCWALKNAELLGSTGENIALVGDSAGGNLITACTIKCIEMGIRKPKGLLAIYAVFLANYAASPSRFLGLMDVILPFSPHMKLFQFYNGQNRKSSKNIFDVDKHRNSDTLDLPQSFLFSPLLTPRRILKEFPKTILTSTNLDPCLDDCVEFAKRLKAEKVKVQLEVLANLNHGFLLLSAVRKPRSENPQVVIVLQFSRECKSGSDVIMQQIGSLFSLDD
jgi:acetyl esterase/lipase